MLKSPAGYETDASSAKFMDILAKYLLASLVGGSAGIYWRALVDK
jgi:hypothetical protein